MPPTSTQRLPDVILRGSFTRPSTAFSCSHALYHCSIESSSGSESEDGDQVCKSILKITDVCEVCIKVQVTTLYGWDSTAISCSLIRWRSSYKHYSSRICKDWGSSPSNSSCLVHHTSVCHHFPRTCLPQYTGCYRDGSCRKGEIRDLSSSLISRTEEKEEKWLELTLILFFRLGNEAR